MILNYPKMLKLEIVLGIVECPNFQVCKQKFVDKQLKYYLHNPNQLSAHLKRLNQGLQEASGGATSEAETTDEETSSPRGRRRRNRR